ncbi:hypothetical protein [Natronomonas moolapensis]|nr:hypothetical protein [Natronomonas moolapensis]
MLTYRLGRRPKTYYNSDAVENDLADGSGRADRDNADGLADGTGVSVTDPPTDGDGDAAE